MSKKVKLYPFNFFSYAQWCKAEVQSLMLVRQCDEVEISSINEKIGKANVKFYYNGEYMGLGASVPVIFIEGIHANSAKTVLGSIADAIYRDRRPPLYSDFDGKPDTELTQEQRWERHGNIQANNVEGHAPFKPLRGVTGLKNHWKI